MADRPGVAPRLESVPGRALHRQKRRLPMSRCCRGIGGLLVTLGRAELSGIVPSTLCAATRTSVWNCVAVRQVASLLFLTRLKADQAAELRDARRRIDGHRERDRPGHGLHVVAICFARQRRRGLFDQLAFATGADARQPDVSPSVISVGFETFCGSPRPGRRCAIPRSVRP